jgi:hypothetical protein
MATQAYRKLTVHWFFADRVMIELPPLEVRAFRYSGRTLFDLYNILRVICLESVQVPRSSASPCTGRM